jgi:hypothetical protein
MSMPYGIPFNVVDGSHQKVNVTFDYADESDAGPYPLGSDTTIENGSDAHAIVIDSSTCRLYETYATSEDSSGWHAGSGAIWSLSSDALRPAGWTSADAAGLPIFAGLVRRDEIAAGVIDHAIRMTVQRTDRSYRWPARHQAGAASDSSLPPMGAWFRLKQSFDTSSFSPEARVVLTAMKTHGMIVADNGSNWYFGGAAEDGWSEGVLDELKSLTAGSFEAVDVSSLMVDADSGQIRQSGARPRVGVSLNVTRTPVTHGSAATLYGTVSPSHAGKRVNVQMLKGTTGQWVNVATRTLDASSSFRVSYTKTSSGYLLFRTAFPTQDADHSWNISRSVRVDWR